MSSTSWTGTCRFAMVCTRAPYRNKNVSKASVLPSRTRLTISSSLGLKWSLDILHGHGCGVFSSTQTGFSAFQAHYATTAAIGPGPRPDRLPTRDRGQMSPIDPGKLSIATTASRPGRFNDYVAHADVKVTGKRGGLQKVAVRSDIFGPFSPTIFGEESNFVTISRPLATYPLTDG